MLNVQANTESVGYVLAVCEISADLCYLRKILSAPARGADAKNRSQRLVDISLSIATLNFVQNISRIRLTWSSIRFHGVKSVARLVFHG